MTEKPTVEPWNGSQFSDSQDEGDERSPKEIYQVQDVLSSL